MIHIRMRSVLSFLIGFLLYNTGICNKSNAVLIETESFD